MKTSPFESPFTHLALFFFEDDIKIEEKGARMVAEAMKTNTTRMQFSLNFIGSPFVLFHGRRTKKLKTFHQNKRKEHVLIQNQQKSFLTV